MRRLRLVIAVSLCIPFSLPGFGADPLAGAVTSLSSVSFSNPSVAAIVLFLSPTPRIAADSASLRASLSSREVSVHGVTPGGDLVLFGVAVFTRSGVPTRVPVASVLKDDDGDGTITYKPRGGVPFRSLWFSADLANGAVTVVSPEGYEVDHRQIDVAAIKKDADGLAEALEMDGITAELLLVRPKSGAWILRAREGAAGDGDRVKNGRLTLLFESAEPLGGGKDKAPKKLKAGDVLAVLDPGRLELRTLTVTK